MKTYSVKIGIFAVGLEIKNTMAQHTIKAWVRMEGKTFRSLKRRIRAKRMENLRDLP